MARSAAFLFAFSVWVGCGHTRPPASRETAPQPADRVDVLCPEGVQVDWAPPSDWRAKWNHNDAAQTTYETPHGTHTLCSFSALILPAQEDAAAQGRPIPHPLHLRARLETLGRAQTRGEEECSDKAKELASKVRASERDAEEAERAQADAANTAAAAELLARAEAYAAANLRKVAGIELCDLKHQESAWREEMQAERRAAAISGTIDKALMHQAGVALVELADSQGSLVRAVTAKTGKAPACDAFARAAFACKEACSDEQATARAAVEPALASLRSGH